MTIREYLEKNHLITDGSFGTYYAEKYDTQEMPEYANIKYPQRVMEIHESYLEAGAKLIRTNTFASNTVLMSSDIQMVVQNIKSAIEIAKKAVEQFEKEVYIAGDIGPIPNDKTLENEDMINQYLHIAECFIEEGIKILTFETFSELESIIPVIEKIKNTYQDIFIMVQFCVNQFGYSNAGLSAKKLIKEAEKIKSIDAVGFNCGVGPGHMKQILSQIGFGSEKYVIALPNAGYPEKIRDRIKYYDNPEYFAEIAGDIAENGIDIIGGCCGTNPVYIDRLSRRISEPKPKKQIRIKNDNQEDKIIRKRGFLFDENGNQKKKKLVAVELAPPLNANDGKILSAARMMKEAGVDVLTFPDSPSGRTRVDSILMAKKVKMETGLNVMPHICCRDKNAIAMRSVLLGAHINDINNMLIITGDPVPGVARQTVKSVFNFDSVGLMKIVNDMNDELFVDRPITYGGAINQGRRNINVEIGRVKKKIDAGAQFFMTQPVFSIEDVNRLRMVKEATHATILCGIMPLISRKNALFMKNEIAGVIVTDEIVDRYPANVSKEEGEMIGIEIAKEIIEMTRDFVDGYYFSFPFNRVEMFSYLKNTL